MVWGKTWRLDNCRPVCLITSVSVTPASMALEVDTPRDECAENTVASVPALEAKVLQRQAHIWTQRPQVLEYSIDWPSHGIIWNRWAFVECTFHETEYQWVSAYVKHIDFGVCKWDGRSVAVQRLVLITIMELGWLKLDLRDLPICARWPTELELSGWGPLCGEE